LNTQTIRQVNLSEADELLRIGKKTFLDAFEHLNTAEDIKIYTQQLFTTERTVTELSNPDSVFYFIENEGNIMGYIKLNYASAQNEFKETDGVEIERIYVLADYQGKQIGQQLLNFAIDTAHRKSLNYIWLGVWENNINAMRFYERNGFEPVGSHYFILGNDKQTDILMRRGLA
jgi:ribosomal protein S18 acetylase RimI-like enzyme